MAANPCKFRLSLSLAGGFLKSPSVLVTNCQSSTMQGNKAGEGRHSCNGKRQSLANEVYEQLNPRKIPRKLAGDDGEGRRWGKVSPKEKKLGMERERERESRIRAGISLLLFPFQPFSEAPKGHHNVGYTQ